MSLRKKQTMTQRKVSANQANGKHSKGPATAEGRKQIREANTRHGFYSQPEAVALVCLGEDPADLERLRKNLHQEGAVKETGEIALALLYQLQKPGTGKDGTDPEERRRHVMNKIRAIFGLSPLEKEGAEVPTPGEQSPQAEGDGQEFEGRNSWVLPLSVTGGVRREKNRGHRPRADVSLSMA
jgi:hypothetical protein